MRLTRSSLNTGKPYLKRASDEKTVTKPTVSEILARAFGSDFSGASQDQRLLLLEAVALSLRTGGAWSNMLHFVCSRTKTPKMPEDCFLFGQITTNEGLKLIAILNVAIVEGYSVLEQVKGGCIHE